MLRTDGILNSLQSPILGQLGETLFSLSPCGHPISKIAFELLNEKNCPECSKPIVSVSIIEKMEGAVEKIDAISQQLTNPLDQADLKIKKEVEISSEKHPNFDSSHLDQIIRSQFSREEDDLDDIYGDNELEMQAELKEQVDLQIKKEKLCETERGSEIMPIFSQALSREAPKSEGDLKVFFEKLQIRQVPSQSNKIAKISRRILAPSDEEIRAQKEELERVNKLERLVQQLQIIEEFSGLPEMGIFLREKIKEMSSIPKEAPVNPALEEIASALPLSPQTGKYMKM